MGECQRACGMGWALPGGDSELDRGDGGLDGPFCGALVVRPSGGGSQFGGFVHGVGIWSGVLRVFHGVVHRNARGSQGLDVLGWAAAETKRPS